MTHQGPRDPRSDRHGSAKTTCVACCAKNKTDPDRKFCCDARNSTPGSSDWEARLGLLRNYMTQPLVELYGGCMVALKASWCGIRYDEAAPLAALRERFGLNWPNTAPRNF